ncbi:MAG: hypothetical protein U1G07_01375 [Verrucomicrobiota bacterium]
MSFLPVNNLGSGSQEQRSWLLFRTIRFAATLSPLLLLGGCHSAPLQKVVLGPDYQPSNYHRRSDHLPVDFRRVAVLPITCDSTHADTLAGSQTLEPVFRTELLKTSRFEVNWVSPDDLGRWTGQKQWDADAKLPPDFFAKLRDQLGCDGVLFCRLNRYRPYPPLAIGWNLRLVETAHLETLWAIDELFDGGEPLVVNAARRYENQHQKGTPTTDTPLILTSPSRFGQYTAWAALSTLPTR